jgi:hypothetical protein
MPTEQNANDYQDYKINDYKINDRRISQTEIIE